MINPYVILAILVMWLASVVGVGRWQNVEGHAVERAAWQARENKQLLEANAKIMQMENAARAIEAAHAQAMATIAATHAKELRDAANQKARDVAAVRAGALQLRIPATACPSPGGGGPAETPATAAERNGTATTELPRQIESDLFSLADDADAIVRQLTECQAVVRDDRNASP